MKKILKISALIILIIILLGCSVEAVDLNMGVAKNFASHGKSSLINMQGLYYVVNTLYGNPLRRAWIELNYIYFYIIREIEKMSFKLFVTEAEWFLSKEEDIRQQMSGVNLCSLRLSDMGNTTLGVTAPPYDEIAQEAFSVWELFEGKYR